MNVLEIGSCCASAPQMFADALNTSCMIFRDNPYITQAKKTISFHKIAGIPFDHDIINRVLRLPQALSICREFDVLHFHVRSFLPGYMDLLFLDGQIKVMHHRGSEVRGTKQPELTPFDLRLVSTPDLLQYVPGAVYLQNPVQPYPYIGPDTDWDLPRVLHIPSLAGRKGTVHVYEAAKELAGEILVDIVQGVSHAEALSRIASADLVIDQVTPYGAHGVVSIEALYMGKPVLCSIDPSLYPPDCPIIPVKPDGSDLADAIREAMCVDLKYIGRAGHLYAHKHHDPKTVAKQFIKLVEAL